MRGVCAQPLLSVARAIHDTCQPRGEHAEHDADAGEQEHGRNGELDRMGDVDDFDTGRDGQPSRMAWSNANRARLSRAPL